MQALHAAFHPAASIDGVLPANRLVSGRPLDPVLDLGVSVGAGLGHSAPTLMDLDPQQSKSVAQVSCGSLLSPAAAAAASMQATDGSSTSAVPAAVADPALAAGPAPADTPMLPAAAMPLSVPPDFPDTAVSSAMCLWAEDVDIPVDIARQAVLYVHANFALELSQHPSADCTCLSKPLQELMVTAVRAVTGDASFYLMYGSDAIKRLRSRSSLRQRCGRQPLHANHVSNSEYGSCQTVRQAAQTSCSELNSAPAAPGGAQ